MRFKYIAVGDKNWEYAPTGLTVVTGKNGSGKSTAVVEARAYALFGKMMRGAPAPPGFTVGAEVETDTGVVHVERDAKGLVWANDGEKPVAWETKTKAQEALLQRLGVTHTTWATTTVFSSAGVGSFTQATDTERKVLVEALLGLGAFDTAYTRAKREARDAELRAASWGETVRAAILAVEQAQQSLALVSSVEVRDPTPVDPPDAGIATRIQALTHDIAACTARSAEASQALGAAVATRRGIESLATVSGLDACPTCTRPVDEEFRVRVATKAAEVRASTDADSAAARARMAEADAAVGAYRREISALVAQRSAQETAYNAYLRDVQRVEGERSAQAQRLSRAAGVLQEAEIRLAQAKADQVAAQHNADVAAAAMAVLGPTGVRAALLDRVLGAVEAQANMYGSRIGAFPVEIQSTTQLASGETRDKIALLVLGRPSPDSLSTGERRRLDVAILFAFASVVGTAGEIILDECFDGLDDVGVEAVADVLRDMSATRPVVVITHNERLAARLRAGTHWTF